MASPSTIITLGFGSFGGVNLLPTLGYGIASETGFDVAGIEHSVPQNRMHYTVPRNRMHFHVPSNRMHQTVPEEDQ